MKTKYKNLMILSIMKDILNNQNNLYRSSMYKEIIGETKYDVLEIIFKKEKTK